MFMVYGLLSKALGGTVARPKSIRPPLFPKATKICASAGLLACPRTFRLPARKDSDTLERRISELTATGIATDFHSVPY